MFCHPFVAQQYLNKIIEVTRVNLFNVITQYRAIFPDEHTNPASDHMNMDLSSGQYYYMDGISCNGDRLFQSWIHRKVPTYISDKPVYIPIKTFLSFLDR